MEKCVTIVDSHMLQKTVNLEKFTAITVIRRVTLQKRVTVKFNHARSEGNGSPRCINHKPRRRVG